MNDRVSAVPPAEFLHGPDAMDADDYEKQFALDWKPPDLELEGPYNNPSPSANGGHRPSFVSTRSGLTRTGTGASGSVWSKAPKQHGSSSTMASSVLGGATTATTPGVGAGAAGFLSRVGGRFNLTRSKSSFDVHDVDEDQGHAGSAGSGGGLGHFIPPVFKHKRSESVNSGATSSAFFKRDGGVDVPDLPFKKSTKGTSRPFSTSAAGLAAGGAAGGAAGAAPSAGGPVLPGFDPTRRPTRDEITANYQNLLASGFFGTHAIQSTRFAPPGQRGEQRQQTPQAREPEASCYFAPRRSEQEDDRLPPSPERQPPPPPPNRLAPPPPPPPAAPSSMEMDTDATSEAIPVSPTILFHPTQSQQRPSSERMPPPPTPPNPEASSKHKPDHKASLSFSAVPYSSTRPGIEPSLVERPLRPPPVSITRFSFDSTGRQSYDLQQQQPPQLPQRALRGIKRPFTTAANGSQTSFATMATPRGSMDYHRDSGQYSHNYAGNNGNSFTAGIGEEDKPESGARKLVKKLRKSASRISIDLSSKRQASISRMASPPNLVDNNNNEDDDRMMDDCQEINSNINNTNATATATATITNQAPAARTSMSSTVRRSFSWRFGKLGKDNTATTNDPVESQGGKSGGGGFFFHSNNAAGLVLNKTDLNRTTTSASHAPNTLHQQPQQPQQQSQATTTTPANHLSNFSFLTDGNDKITTDGVEQQESHLKLRGRRLRKHGSPVKQSPSLMKDLPPPPPASPTKDATTPSMDWQQQQQQQQQGNTSPQRSPARLRKVNRSRSRSRSNVIRVLHDHHSRPGITPEHNTTMDGMPATLTTSLSFSASSNKPLSWDAKNGVSSDANHSNDNMMEGVEFSFHLPGRMRPTSTTNNTAAANGGGGGGGPLAVVPDTNRGMMMMMGHPTGGAATTTTTTATMKEMMMPHYSGRWVDEEDQEDMIF